VSVVVLSFAPVVPDDLDAKLAIRTGVAA